MQQYSSNMDATYPCYPHQDSSPGSQHNLLDQFCPIQHSNSGAEYFSFQDSHDFRQPHRPSSAYSYPDEALPTTPDDGPGCNPVVIARSDYQYEYSPLPESGIPSYLPPFQNTPPSQSLDPRTISPHKVQGFLQTQVLDVPRTNRDHYYSSSESGSDISSPGLPVKQEPARSTSIRSSGSRIDVPPQTKTIVATTKIRDASKRRRSHPAKVVCQTCRNDFTTSYALSRHAVSHTGRRDFPCTKPGCFSRFSTDSGRTRHERSPTLHRP